MKKVAVGVDIGGTNSVYGLVDEAGEIICEGAFPTRNYPDFDQYIEELYIGIQDLLKRAGDEVEVSVSAPRTATTIPARSSSHRTSSGRAC